MIVFPLCAGFYFSGSPLNMHCFWTGKKTIKYWKETYQNVHGGYDGE
jgi:hypothetical protein